MLLDLFYNDKFKAVASPALFLEYEDVLGRPEHKAIHKFTDDRIHGILRDLAHRITPAEIYFRYRPGLRDPNDDLVLEAALNGRAEAIVTHNIRDFLPEASSHRLRVMTPGSIIQERFRL